MSESKEKESTRKKALLARDASLLMRSLPASVRSDILKRLADTLESNETALLEANKKDVTENEGRLSGPLLGRLHLTSKKISTLSVGIRQLAGGSDPLGQVIGATQITQVTGGKSSSQTSNANNNPSTNNSTGTDEPPAPCTQLRLQKVRVPIGVILIIFESRPDALPQIAALAIRSGNALLLKGGSEALHSNRMLARLVTESVVAGVQSHLKAQSCSSEEVAAAVSTAEGLVALLESRSSVRAMLELDDVIDLVIPRGSGKLVRFIQDNTKIPVMGHSEGLCHILFHPSIDVPGSGKTEKKSGSGVGNAPRVDLRAAIRLLIDSKIDYPTGCNAVETLLLDPRWFNKSIELDAHGGYALGILQAIEGWFKGKINADYKVALSVQSSSQQVSEGSLGSVECPTKMSLAAFTLTALMVAGVKIFVDEPTHKLLPKWLGEAQCTGGKDPLIAVTDSYTTEYGDNMITVVALPAKNDSEVLTAAVKHINSQSSGHTDCIVGNAPDALRQFQVSVDSACVFVNASTRFADGYRFGLGAEVGISTARIHARGPVGVEGLTTYKYLLAPVQVTGVADDSAPKCFTLQGQRTGVWQYQHRSLL